MNVFPNELRELIRGIHSDLRQEILSYLIKNQSSTYTLIKDNLKSSKGNFNYHLNTLVESGLLIRQVEKDSKKDEYNTIYSISTLGKYFINNLFKTLQPELQLPKNNFKRVLSDDLQSQKLEFDSIFTLPSTIFTQFEDIQNTDERNFNNQEKINLKLEL